MVSSALQKAVYKFLMLVLFAIPVCMGLQDEMSGKMAEWRYVWATAFVIVLIFLYIWGIVSALRCGIKTDVLYKLFMFHFVKIPIFIALWLICMTGYIVVITFYVNRLDGVQ